MPKPSDPLNLAAGHLCVAGRAAIELHKCLTLAGQAAQGQDLAIDLALHRLTHNQQMLHLAAMIDELPVFFRGNLPASLRMAAGQAG